jgi:DNA-binding MarR family transcriptional regulator
MARSRSRAEQPIERLHRDAYIRLALLAGAHGADIEAICRTEHLTEGHYRILWVLCLSDEVDGLTMGDIVDGLVTRAADATRLVDKLVRLDLVERLADQRDRRKVIVRPTEAGHRVFLRLTDRIKAVHHQQWAGLTKAELGQLSALLHKALWGRAVA